MIYIVIAALIVITVFFVYRQSSGYNIVKYNISTGKSIKSPVNFVMLSDLHDTDVTKDHNKRLLESIAAQSPDFVILAGDMITSSRGGQTAREFLKGLTEICPVYYGLGNHEQRYREDPEDYPGKFKDLEEYVAGIGAELLSDRYVDHGDSKIRIYGYDVPMDNYRRMVTNDLPEGILKDTFGEPDRDRFNILVAHTPDFFEEYVRFGPDLVLSGHLHGGIVAFPGIGGLMSPQLKLFPKYDSGLFRKDNTTMIVSRGIGWHSIPIRIFNKAEIVSVTIVNEINCYV